MFVTFEGVDGSGKSTQAALLADWLEAAGRPVLRAREPGKTTLGESVRDLVLHGDEMSPWAEAALFAAARAELVAREIRPALERGEDVVLDRYLDSSVAYQGAGRGLGEEAVRGLSLTVTGGLLPDRTFLIDVDPEVGRARGSARPDRIEREDEAFAGRVAAGYRRLAAAEPGRVVAVDGRRSPQEIAEEIREHVRALL
ncbi:MAG TPA: dTMP kinase [Gaiellaceae bacterium]|jgi:dTMP kinase|nr:dTMP kinase [Gaiellaceae bacterium]